MNRVFALERFVTCSVSLCYLDISLVQLLRRPPMRRARWRHLRLCRSKKRASSSTPRWPTRETRK